MRIEYLQRWMIGCLLFVGSILAGLGIGLSVGFGLRSCGCDPPLANTLGTAGWLFSIPIILVYGSLYFSRSFEVANPAQRTAKIPSRSAQLADTKVRTAVPRLAFVFAMIGGVLAASIQGANSWVVTIVAIFCAIVRGLIGYDYRRRCFRLRAQLAATSDATAN